MKEQQIALVALALGKVLHEQWAEDAKKLYLNAEKKGYTPEKCSKISSGVIRDGDILRKWRPPKDEGFKFDASNPTHDEQNQMIDIMNIPFEELPKSWKGTNLEAGLVAAILVGSEIEFNIENLDYYIASYAPVVHDEWMKRNEWEKDSKPELFVPYAELTPEMKSLDDAHIKLAVKLFGSLQKGNQIISVEESTLETTIQEVEQKSKTLLGSNSKGIN